MKYKLTWDLESIFPGGSQSQALQNKLALTKEWISDYQSLNQNWDPQLDKPNYKTLVRILALDEKITNALSQAGSFINAVQSTDVTDTHANAVIFQVGKLRGDYNVVQTSIIKKFAAITDEDFSSLLT